MKLDDFLKCKKVRCVSNDYDFNEQGKAYKLHGLRVFITDETGCTAFLPIEDFEPVLDSAENPLQKMELTPEFAVEPKFRVGDKVYVGLTGKIETVEYFDIRENEMITQADEVFNAKKCCHATTENYERLQATFPDIKFERPPLTGSDLARAMLDKGWKYVPCFVSNESDDFAQKMKLTDLIIALDGDRSKEFVGDDVWRYAVPIDPRTGEPLTESILND